MSGYSHLLFVIFPIVDSDMFQKLGSLFGSGGKKEQVDPYCTISFAGHSEKTPTLMSTMNPVWNTAINLGVRVRKFFF